MQLAFVLYPGLTALDLVGPYEVLRMIPSAEVRFVAQMPGPVATDSGALVLGATHSFAETPAPDLVVVPGGSTGNPAAMANDELLTWLRRAHTTTTWTTSVCGGSVILAAAGLLRGQPATGHWMGHRALAALGAVPRRDERIVRSGKIVTAAGVSAGIDLGLWLLGEISGRERAEMVQLMIEYDPQPPFDTGHPSKVPASLRRTAVIEMAKQADAGVVADALAATSKLAWRRALEAVRRR